MKKKHFFTLLVCLAFFVSGSNLLYAQTIGCPGCTVSSNSGENWGHCEECIEGGDYCVSFGGGPACDGVQE